MGSRSPLEMITKVPLRSAAGGSAYGTIAASSTAPVNRLGPPQHHRRSDVCSIGESHGDQRSIRRFRTRRWRSPRTRRARRPGAAESSSSKTPSRNRRKNRGMPFSRTVPRTESTAAPWRKMITQRQQVVLIAAGAVQAAAAAVRPRHPSAGKKTCGRSRPVSAFTGCPCRAGAVAERRRSVPRSGSSHGGSLRLRPSSSSGSSTAKPGASVAISNNTPPGSRK